MSKTIKAHDWFGLYGGQWKGEIVPEAFSHPAKFARGLIRRIYEHALEQGYLREGDTVLDVFGGIGCGAIDATRMKLQWVGLDLERDFVIISHRNFAELARKEWCTCDEEGQTYLRAMREAFREKLGRGQSEAEAKDGAVLQQGVSQQIPLFGKTVKRIYRSLHYDE